MDVVELAGNMGRVETVVIDSRRMTVDAYFQISGAWECQTRRFGKIRPFVTIPA
jgi:hypothetical protein